MNGGGDSKSQPKISCTSSYVDNRILSARFPVADTHLASNMNKSCLVMTQLYGRFM